MVILCRVIAADAGACWSTEAIIGEAFAVELETAAFTTVAGLGCLDHGLEVGIVLISTGHRCLRCLFSVRVVISVCVSVVVALEWLDSGGKLLEQVTFLVHSRVLLILGNLRH